MGKHKRVRISRQSSTIRSSVDRQFSPSKQTDGTTGSSLADSDGGDTDESGPQATPAKRPRTSGTGASTVRENLDNIPGKCCCAQYY